MQHDEASTVPQYRFDDVEETLAELSEFDVQQRILRGGAGDWLDVRTRRGWHAGRARAAAVQLRARGQTGRGRARTWSTSTTKTEPSSHAPE